MKRIIVAALFSVLLFHAFGQSEYLINDFSDAFYARIMVNQEGSGTVSILRKMDQVSVLKVQGDQLNFVSKPGSKIMKYADQTILVSEDFNFDGEKDLGILEFFSTKGPAYAIYLFREGSFKKDEAYTRIIEESQGSYELNPSEHTISIRNTGGCCLHASATYKVIAGRPDPLHEQSEEVNPPYTTLITREWTGGKKTEVITKTLNLEDEPFMSFVLAGNKKKVLLFSTGDQTLNYALVKENDQVEFNFPTHIVDKNPDFTMGPFGDELVFRNASAEYKIYQKVNAGRIEAVGILVKTGGKEYDLKGDMRTLIGSLKDIPDMDNLVK